MPDALAEQIHHVSVRTYRQELALGPVGLKLSTLLTLMARAKIAAKEHGWSATAD
jgi:hypothetical protein